MAIDDMLIAEIVEEKPIEQIGMYSSIEQIKKMHLETSKRDGLMAIFWSAGTFALMGSIEIPLSGYVPLSVYVGAMTAIDVENPLKKIESSPFPIGASLIAFSTFVACDKAAEYGQKVYSLISGLI